MEPEITGLFRFSLQASLRVFQEGTEFEDQINVAFEWKYPAEVTHPGIAIADAPPAAVGFLLCPRGYLVNDLPQFVDHINYGRWIKCKQVVYGKRAQDD